MTPEGEHFYVKIGNDGIVTVPSDCVKNVILSEAKDLKWPKNEILRYTQNDKKREKCFFTQSDVPSGVRLCK
ncbi:MAG: hypothetical protein ACOCG5_10345 [Candidatus Alkaliphilus sp. MAG34]